MRQRRVLAAAMAGALVAVAGAGGCSDDDREPTGLDRIVENSRTADWDIRAGVEVVTVYGADPGQPLSLYDAEGERLTTSEADDEGRANFAYIPDDPDVSFDEALAAGGASGQTLRPGEYVIRDDSARPRQATAPFEVLGRHDVPDEALYEGQELDGVSLDLLGAPAAGSEAEDGYQYLEMRDGVTLSAMVRFPDRSLYGDGPWPTVVEYSGYGPSNPGSEEPGSRIARSLGYATVSVNMRGTGCSGGVFDSFNPAQQADGYDVIEIVGRQPWVLNGKVGMVGLSYSGIAQLYTAATRPPSLAAVTAQSVIADPWLEQWPGGIYNDGFTRQWLEERERQSGAEGSGWVQARIAGGDGQCRTNVTDHELGFDFAAFAQSLAMRPADAEARDLRELVHDIEVPVFITGAFEDEQTGPQFGALLDGFENARALRVGLWNGRHPDGYSTMNMGQLYEFLELYVAERVPEMQPALRAALPGIVAEQFGFATGDLPPDRFTDHRDDYEAALAEYEDEDPVRVVFGSGHGTDEVGEPGGTWEATFPAWPPPDAEPTSWYLGADGELGTESSGDRDVDTFTFDPAAGGTTSLPDYSTLEPLQQWRWTRFPTGKSVAYQTAPLDEDLVVAGSGYLDVWVGADAGDADVQVAVSEVRSDGVEYLVQNGWLRLGHRAVDDERSTDLEIVHPFTEDAYEPLPGDAELVEARIEIPAMGHVFAEGSRLRLTISSPGRNHVTWTFAPPEGVTARTTYRIGRGESTPSALVLPVVDVEPRPEPDTPAPCPGLRGMPCRRAAPIANRTEPASG
jgi:predicted acyl esterase